MLEEQNSYISTPSLSGLIQQLTHLSQFGADALVVEGVTGSGKTTLLAHFFELMQDNESREIPVTTSSFCVDEGLETFDNLSSLAASLGVVCESDSSGGLISRLRSFVEALLREKRLAIVLIDDSENLSSEALGAFLSLLQNESDGAFGLKFIFFSTPGFVQNVDDIGLFDLAIYDFQIPPFTALEIEKLITERYPDYQIGEGQGGLSAQALWNRSEGIPGKALILVEEQESKDGQSGLAEDIRKMPVLHLVIVAVLLAGLVLLFLYRGGDDAAQDKLVPPMLEAESEFSSGVLSSEEAPSQSVATISDKLGLQQEGAVGASNEPKKAVKADVKVLVAENTAEADRNAEADAGIDVVQSSMEGTTSDLSVDDSETKEDSNLKLSEPVEDLPSTTQSSLFVGEEKLLGQDDSGFVLQMLAASQKKSLEEFISTQENKDMMQLYRKRRDSNRTWYIVVVGPFSSKSEAQRAILNLPASQRKAGPWPRSMKAVKDEIRAFHEL